MIILIDNKDVRNKQHYIILKHFIITSFNAEGEYRYDKMFLTYINFRLASKCYNFN